MASSPLTEMGETQDLFVGFSGLVTSPGANPGLQRKVKLEKLSGDGKIFLPSVPVFRGFGVCFI